VTTLQQQVNVLTQTVASRDAALAMALANQSTSNGTPATGGGGGGGETVTRCICNRCERLYWNATGNVRVNVPTTITSTTTSTKDNGRAESPFGDDCSYHAGAWSVDDRAKDFVMFDAKLKDNLRAEKAKRLKVNIFLLYYRLYHHPL
jgi:hypothetical protein